MQAEKLTIEQLIQQAEAFKASANYQAAEQAYLQALVIDQQNPAIYYDLGSLRLSMHHAHLAIEDFLNALNLAPNHPQILLQLGNCYSALHQQETAANYFKHSAQAEPSNAAFFNLGNAQREMGQTEQALASYQRAIQLNPKDADAYNNMGNVLRELGQLDKAIQAYETALQLNPKLYHAKVHLVHQKQHICDWQHLSEDIQQIRDWVNHTPHALVSPFAFLAMPETTALEQLKCSSNWLNKKYNQLNKLNINKDKKQNLPIKIAYLSSDFRLHPLAFLITELIESHDRTRFETLGYAYGLDDKSAERKRLEKAFDSFINIQDWSLEAVAKDIAAREVDILVDLTGYTQTSRSGIAAMRPAKVQVNWLGFAGSMGYITRNEMQEPLFDYLITDETITPKGVEQGFAETLIKLPCYQPNNSTRPVGNLPSRESLGLPVDAFVFCCFNQTFKITPDVFKVWMQILKALPNSVLWLLECNRWAKANLIKAAEQSGIAVNRLIFAPRVPIADHLARHQHADLFLDTLPYNAHTTCSDALYMGLPVLTLCGETFASRVAASLLKQCQLDTLITQDLTQYQTLAVKIAQDRHLYQQIKQKLTQPEHLPLFEPASFVKKLEQAYLDMLELTPR